MRSNAASRKAELLADLMQTRQEIIDLAQKLPSAAHDQVFLGVWSVMDLLAHLAGWDVANLEAVQALRAGKLPAFYAFAGPDWRDYNARLVAQYRQATFTEQLASVQATHQALLDCLAARLPEELERDWGVRWKGIRVMIARLIQSELRDEKVHLAQIQEFLDRGL